MLTAVMVSGESRAAVAVGAEVLVHLQPFPLNSSAYKSIEVTPLPHFEQLSNLPKILKEQFISLSLFSHILETSLFWLLSLSLSSEAANAEVVSVLDHIGAPHPV